MTDSSDKINPLEEEARKVNLRCGEILRLGYAVESQIEYFIRDFFECKDHYREIRLRYWVIVKLSFEQKIQIVHKICKDNITDSQLINGLNNALKFVQKTRNAVAHHEFLINDPREIKILMHKKAESWTGEDTTELGDELVEKVKEEKIKIYTFLREATKQIEMKKDMPRYF